MTANTFNFLISHVMCSRFEINLTLTVLNTRYIRPFYSLMICKYFLSFEPLPGLFCKTMVFCKYMHLYLIQ